MRARKKHKGLFWAALAGASLTAALGFALVWYPFSGALARASFDLPFALRPAIRVAPQELVMVYLDAQVKANLGEPRDQPLNWRYYARLLQRVKQDGAKLVVYDFILDEPGEDHGPAQEFAQALATNGPVVLMGDFVKELSIPDRCSPAISARISASIIRRLGTPPMLPRASKGLINNSERTSLFPTQLANNWTMPFKTAAWAGSSWLARLNP